MDKFERFFRELTKNPDIQPHKWQSELAGNYNLSNRLIRIPTGFGKTLGVLSAWLWNRVRKNDDKWPLRLVWCLPMRVLVEQTENEVRMALDALGLLWTDGDHSGKVGVHQLMGGANGGDWHLYPEECAVLIGTQDMLLSRAMNRGYAAARARWPMDFGLLNQDCLWVMDEVQLMDVGLITSAQLQAFRDVDSELTTRNRPCHTWWMSATLQPEWLKTSPDTLNITKNLPETRIPACDRTGNLWDTDKVTKPCRLVPSSEKELAALITTEHINAGNGANGPTLVVVNTVNRAVEIYESLQKDKKMNGVELRLIHSRFRPCERAPWRKAFLNRSACAPGTNRIIIATQVIEAGVDISAGLLITELAPWASLVQRFGRCARWGGKAEVIVADLNLKNTAPYDTDEVNAARNALTLLGDVAPFHLESFEEQHSELLDNLYPYNPEHLLLRHELDELFDTNPDLSGADIDISRFIRTGDERDLQVFWIAGIPKGSSPSPDLKPVREALCSVPFLAVRDWLCGKETKSERKPKLKSSMHAWVWDWLDGEWRKVERKDLYPGQVVMVAAECGGYDENRGWTGKAEDQNFSPIEVKTDSDADTSQDNESSSRLPVWQTIATHGREAGLLAKRIAGLVAPELTELFYLAGRLHDTGKSHDYMQDLITSEDRPDRRDLAKAPDTAWSKKRSKGYRHELASAIALFAVLQRHTPDHQALLGPWRNLLTSAGLAPDSGTQQKTPHTSIEEEIIGLTADQFNLLAYLVCAHHGKVRMVWHSCPADQMNNDSVIRIRGIQENAVLPEIPVYCTDGSLSLLPRTALTLAPASVGLNRHTGQGWTERVLNLHSSYGPFTLAWLEALLRAADQRASKHARQDDLLSKEVTA